MNAKTEKKYSVVAWHRDQPAYLDLKLSTLCHGEPIEFYICEICHGLSSYNNSILFYSNALANLQGLQDNEQNPSEKRLQSTIFFCSIFMDLSSSLRETLQFAL